MILQIMAPAAYALTANSDSNARSLICAPLSIVSADALSEADALLQALGIEGETDPEENGHCPLCLFAYAAPLPAPLAAPLPSGHAQSAKTHRYDIGASLLKTGPPLGQRGPPVLY